MLERVSQHRIACTTPESDCVADLGSNVYIWPELAEGMMTALLVVDDTPLVLFRMQDSHLLLTVQLFDEHNEMLVQILDNELVYSVDQWDVEFEGLRLTVRAAHREIFVRMSFRPPSRVQIDRGHVWWNGVENGAWPDRLVVMPGMTISGSKGLRCPLGIAIGDHPKIGGMFSFGTPMRTDWTPYAGTEEPVLRIMEPDRDRTWGTRALATAPLRSGIRTSSGSE